MEDSIKGWEFDKQNYCQIFCPVEVAGMTKIYAVRIFKGVVSIEAVL
jgi:hypothetical protein